jgi:hypothetical protein
MYVDSRVLNPGAAKKRGHELFANFALGTISNEGTFLGGLIAFL